MSTYEVKSYRRKKTRGTLAGVLGATMIALTAFTGSAAVDLLHPPAAYAAGPQMGPGIGWNGHGDAQGAGAYVIDGEMVYCLEIDIFPGDDIPTFKNTSSLPAFNKGGTAAGAVSGGELKQISYVISKYGQTDDNAQAAAVSLAVWKVRDRNGGNAAHNEALQRVINVTGAQINAKADSMLAEAAAWVAAGGGGNDATESPGVNTEPGKPYVGTVSVPQGATEISITNGKFNDGTTKKTWGEAGAPANTTLSWNGIPPSSDKWDKYYRVSFDGSKTSIADSVMFGDGGGWQSLAKAAPSKTVPFKEAYVDPDTTWAPLVSSEVESKFISVGENFSDTITFSPAEATDARSGEWRWRMNGDKREYMPVKATGTLYGPFLNDPALNPSQEAPKGAPVAATIDFTTDVNRDHSTAQTYKINPDVAAQEQGYYTWKWDIDGNDQDPSVTGKDDCTSPDREAGCRVFPTNYFYTDGFGAKGETQVGKMNADFSTKLSSHNITIGDSFTDEITIDPMVNWLYGSDGQRLPLTLTGTAYLTEGEELAQSVEVPEDAEVLGTVTATTDSSQNGQVVTSESIRLPLATDAKFTHITMRWCIVNEDQENAESQGVWEEKCDDFGVPEESAEIERPQVTTQAKQLATIHDGINDTAIVNGVVPETTTVVFDLYKKVEKGDAKRDENGEKTDETWTQEEIDALGDDAVCVAQNRVTRTEGIPVESGKNDNTEYDSPTVEVDEEGTYWWIESLITEHPDEGEVVIHEGECGLPNETTTVDKPKVTTKATPEVKLGDEAHDTAKVTGPIPGKASGIETVVTFEAFKKTGKEATCTVDNRVFNLDKPVTVTKAGEYKSEKVVFKKKGTYYWVETLTYIHKDGTKEKVHEGECGLPNETTKVVDKPVVPPTTPDEKPATQLLASTGSDGTQALIWGAVALVAAAAGAGLLAYRHRKLSVASREGEGTEIE
ncbi:MAG: hypothetical protein ACTJFR_01190 [Canibacter sp.]